MFNFNKLMGGDENSSINQKLMDSAAFNKMNLLQGYEGIWINARRNNCYYILNKVLSMLVALFFALVTLSFKRTTYRFME